MGLTITHTFVSTNPDGTNPALVKSSNWNANHLITGNLTDTVNTITFSSTPTFDCSLGNIQLLTLTGDVSSSTCLNIEVGQTVKFIIIQDSVGNRTFVWPTNVHGGIDIALGNTNQKCTQSFISYDGVNLYAQSIGMII